MSVLSINRVYREVDQSVKIKLNLLLFFPEMFIHFLKFFNGVKFMSMIISV